MLRQTHALHLCMLHLHVMYARTAIALPSQALIPVAPFAPCAACAPCAHSVYSCTAVSGAFTLVVLQSKESVSLRLWTAGADVLCQGGGSRVVARQVPKRMGPPAARMHSNANQIGQAFSCRSCLIISSRLSDGCNKLTCSQGLRSVSHTATLTCTARV